VAALRAWMRRVTSSTRGCMADSPTDYQLLFLQHNHRLKDVYFSFWTKCNGFYHNNRKETTSL
ncbi:hypothetical protein NAG17_23640, partial [Pseudomonas aeruginosa]|nr:hypothetical protein [Pseudomonas aeruginosa]